MLEQIIFNTWIPFPHYIKFLYRHINAVLAVLKGQYNGYQIQYFIFNLSKILQNTHRSSDSAFSAQESE